jgi:beta-glucosidase
VSDWDDINNLWKRDHIAASKKDAVKLTVNARIDMSMTANLDFCDYLVVLAREGSVPIS